MMKLATGIENRLMEAKKLMNKREFDRSSQIYKEVLKQYPDNLDCLVNLLYIAQYPNQATPEEVEDLYQRARAASPQLAEVYMYHGTALAAQGKFDPAVTELDKAIQLKPKNAEAHAWLADVRERQHRPADAIEQYRIAIEQQPDFRIARLELAKDLLYAGRSSEAIPVLLPALQVDRPEHARCDDVPGAGLREHGRSGDSAKISRASPSVCAAQRAIESAAADRK